MEDSPEFNELRFQKMVQARGLRRIVQKMDDDFAKIAKDFREKRKAKLEEITNLEQEIDCQVLQLELFK